MKNCFRKNGESKKILFMDRMERKAREERERKEKKWHNPFSHFIKKIIVDLLKSDPSYC